MSVCVRMLVSKCMCVIKGGLSRWTTSTSTILVEFYIVVKGRY